MKPVLPKRVALTDSLLLVLALVVGADFERVKELLEMEKANAYSEGFNAGAEWYGKELAPLFQRLEALK